ncbi:MAG TPA: hypothetical protein VFM53_14685 [Anaeromyxobacteraceae bacterium]|nr:hypothetical protein [Anaeromyxobacteraceae bacterium]
MSGVVLGLVVAVCAAGCTSSSNDVVAEPASPTSIAVESADGASTITWASVPGATSYNLYWSTSEPVTKTNGQRIAGVVSPYRHTGLTNGLRYYYVVTAVHPQGESCECSQASCVPRPPTPGTAPGNVSAVAGDGSIRVLWSPVGRAESYSVHWAKAPGVIPGAAGVTAITGIKDLSFDHTGLVNGDRYYYVVTAVNLGGEGPASQEVSAVPALPPPAAPANLVVVAGDGSAELSWSPVDGATAYNVYAGKTEGFPLDATTLLARLSGTRFTHANLTNGEQYRYVVTAVGLGGESCPCAEATCTPMPPTPSGVPAVVRAVPGDGSVRVLWSPVGRADSYVLYWSNTAGIVAGGPGVTAVRDLKVLEYDHTGLTNGLAYHYAIAAVNLSGEGPLSAEVSATPIAPAPAAPTGLVAVASDAAVDLAWSAVPGATSYDVYWANSPGVQKATGTRLQGQAQSQFRHEGLVNGTTYYYVVTATGPGGEGPQSAEVSARPLPPPPEAPLGVSAIANKEAGNITVQWFDVAGATGFNLYRGTQPNLATYYKDTTRVTLYGDVLAGFVDTAVVSGTTYYYVVTAFTDLVESEPSAEVSGMLQGSGSESTTIGNNLSFPLVLADGYGLTGTKVTGTWQGAGPFAAVPAFDFGTGLRPTSTETLTAFPFLDTATSVTIGGVRYYPQAGSSTWQAEWRSNAAGAEVPVIVGWGSEITSRPFNATQTISIAPALLQDATIVTDPADVMTAYRMAVLSGTKDTEVQGTTGVTYTSVARNVFAINLRLKIEKLDDGGNPVFVAFDKALYQYFGASEGGSGGGSTSGSSTPKLAAAVNGPGAVTYTYNLRPSTITFPAGVTATGTWRLTLILDPEATVGTAKVPNHVLFRGADNASAVVAEDGMSSSVVIQVK